MSKDRNLRIDELSSSGEIRTNTTGAIRDNAEGKGRIDLIPFDSVYKLKRLENSYGKKIEPLEMGEVLQSIYGSIDYFIQTDDIFPLINAVLNYTHTKYGSLEKGLLEASHRYESGALKYGTFNWQKGMPYSWFIDSGIRHLLLDITGLQDEPHDQAFMWNMLCLISTHANNKDMNDVKYMVRDNPESLSDYFVEE